MSSQSDEGVRVRVSGHLWGKAPRLVAGGGPPCVKAYLGPLPEDESGYTFETFIPPTRLRRFWGTAGAVWEEGSPGVEEVPGKPGYVRIAVTIRDAPT